jgi:hypothetical protein
MIGRGSPPLVEPMRALLCARQSRSRAAQLVVLDSEYCAPSAGCTVPLVFLPTSARDSARHGLSSCTRAAAWGLMRSQSVHARRIGGGLQRNRAPLDAEDGVPVSAAAAASGTTSSAFLVPTAPRTAWQLANSVSQMVTPDAFWGAIWAWQTTPNVASTPRIEAQPLQRARYEAEPTTVNPLICDEGQVQCEPKGDGRTSVNRRGMAARV